MSLLPMCLDDIIAEDNVVGAIDVIVDNMDIQSFGFTHSETKETVFLIFREHKKKLRR